VGSLKGSFYWGFCDWGLEERWKMVKIGGFIWNLIDFCWEIHRICYRTTYRLEVVGLGRGKVVIFVGGG